MKPNKNIKYSEYLSGKIDGNTKYSENLSENLDKLINYSEYLSGNLKKTLNKPLNFDEYEWNDFENTQSSKSNYVEATGPSGPSGPGGLSVPGGWYDGNWDTNTGSTYYGNSNINKRKMGKTLPTPIQHKGQVIIPVGLSFIDKIRKTIREWNDI